jgi:uncharacterized membrane protein YfhO
MFQYTAKGMNMKTAAIVRWIPLTIVAFAIVSIVELLQLDVIVNKTLYSYGLFFSDDWAVPYWNTIRPTIAMLFLILVVAIILLAAMFFVKSSKTNGGKEESESTKEKHWNTYKLSDGSTIRIKTVLKGVKRLNTFTEEGKPVYSVKADNVVEVMEAPRQLMKPEDQEKLNPD